MFFPEFSDRQYEERLWPAVQFLEAVMRNAVRMKPREYGLPPKEEIKRSFEALLAPFGFPPEELGVRDDDLLVDTFIESEFENIRVLAEDTLKRFPDGWGSAEDMRADLATFEDSLLAPMRASATYRETVREGKFLAWIETALARLEKECDADSES